MDGIAKLQHLYELKKSTDAQIAKIENLLGEDAEAPKTRKPQKCSHCNEEGHTARNCPAKIIA